jgi:hypothetical protein
MSTFDYNRFQISLLFNTTSLACKTDGRYNGILLAKKNRSSLPPALSPYPSAITNKHIDEWKEPRRRTTLWDHRAESVHQAKDIDDADYVPLTLLQQHVLWFYLSHARALLIIILKLLWLLFPSRWDILAVIKPYLDIDNSPKQYTYDSRTHVLVGV